MRGRVDLEVPFAEKDEVKSLGARWDPACKTWYVPAGMNSHAFQRWLPTGEDEGETELLPPPSVRSGVEDAVLEMRQRVKSGYRRGRILHHSGRI